MSKKEKNIDNAKKKWDEDRKNITKNSQIFNKPKKIYSLYT